MERSAIRERYRRLHRRPRITLRSIRATKKKKNEGSGTPANAGLPTAASCDAARALLERARLTAFHRGSHLRELFHPKGSASGQASWDAVCTGVTRLRLSQSRDAPPTPVVMPGDMMPKPPGSRLQTHPRAPPSLPRRGVPPRHVLHRSENYGVTIIETIVKRSSPKKIRRGLTSHRHVRFTPVSGH